MNKSVEDLLARAALVDSSGIERALRNCRDCPGGRSNRLVRRSCPSCAVPHVPDAETVEKIGGAERLPANGPWRAGHGCDKCGQTGFKGRMGIHELLQVTDELRELIARRAPEHEIRIAARAGGMRTLLEDGIAKAAQGLTTVEAVLQVAAPDDLPVAEGVSADEGGLRNNDTAPETGKARVLIVEDDRVVTTVVKYFLEMEGFEVVLAKDGLIGLEAARQNPPQVIVTDLNMPGMDGMAMVKALRADALTRDIPIIMLTSEESVDSETLALSLGADDYVHKPVEPRRLAARVKALLARSKTRSN